MTPLEAASSDLARAEFMLARAARAFFAASYGTDDSGEGWDGRRFYVPRELGTVEADTQRDVLIQAAAFAARMLTEERRLVKAALADLEVQA